MTGITTGGLPYPDPTEPVADGADAIKSLAEAIDPRLPAGNANGVVAFPSTAGGDTSSVAVTFPAAAFDGVPSVVISPITTAPGSRAVSPSSVTATGFTAYFSNLGTAKISISGAWIAQKRSAALPDTLAAATDDATVTCPTDGCENNGIELPINTHWTDDDTGTVHTVDAIVCGVCGTELTPEATS